MKWNLYSQVVPQNHQELQEVLERNRALAPQELEDFYTPTHPLDLTLEEVGIDYREVDKAVVRLLKAKETQEYVLVFGDYDADGVTATAILWETLYEMGLKALPFIPHREKHGYGISRKAIDELLSDKKKPSLIVTVDNGIVAIEQVKRLKENGIDVIITDHHVPEKSTDLVSQEHLPQAYAIVHSTQLCGATVAWFLSRELDRVKAATLLDLAAIGTISDQMILLKANRSFAYYGIQALQNTKRVGLIELFRLAGIDQAKLSTYSINFVIAPRINAMGRLSSALDALRAICTKDKYKVRQMIQVLQDTNQERQGLTQQMVEEARQKAQEWKDQKIIFVASDQYHEGVIGLIAGRLCEEFFKPAIVVAVGKHFAKASARSVKGVNIISMIREVRDDLIEVGGHPMAAGFGLEPHKIERVKRRLQEIAATQIDQSLLDPRLDVECLLSLELVDVKTSSILQKFEPFGNANREPVFGFQNLMLSQVSRIGKEGKHLKLLLYDKKESSRTIECIAFSQGHLELQIQKCLEIHVAGVISINVWRDRRTIQIIVRDINFINQ